MAREVKDITLQQLPQNRLANDCPYKVPKEKKRVKMVRVEVTYHINSPKKSANTKNKLSKPCVTAAESLNFDVSHACKLRSTLYSLDHGRFQESFTSLFLHTSILHKLTRLMFWVKIAEHILET